MEGYEGCAVDGIGPGEGGPGFLEGGGRRGGDKGWEERGESCGYCRECENCKEGEGVHLPFGFWGGVGGGLRGGAPVFVL